MELTTLQQDFTLKGLDQLDKYGALERETIMNEKRHWVRVSRSCNNKCIFCHDSDAQNGTFLTLEECMEDFKRGREQGCTRLIISGGEASIHPQFIEMIRYGKQVLGFEKVQTITNGSMFANKSFAFACLDAGLDEATFSIHAHQPSLSDKLSGAKDYHVRAVRGLMNLLHSRRCIVNMDIVLTRLNYKFLPDILTYFYKLGVREFDLLYLVPFGRVMHDATENLFLNPQDLAPYLHKTLTLARKWGVVVWTNRLPPPVLEDFEHYIQDPHKIESEMYGRYPEFRRGLDKLEPPSCYGDSCPECYVRDMCGLMQVDNKQLHTTGFEHLEVDALPEHFEPKLQAERIKLLPKAQDLTINARTVFEANRFAHWEPLPAHVNLRLESMHRFDQLDERLRSRLGWVALRDSDSLAAVLSCETPFDLVVELTKSSLDWLTCHEALLAFTGREVRLELPNTEKLSQSYELHADLTEMREYIERSPFPVVNVTPCLSGGKKFVAPEDRFDLALVQEDGKLDIIHYANHYIRHDYYSKSLRCRECVHDSDCPGVHINIVRNFGFKQAVTPITRKAAAAR